MVQAPIILLTGPTAVGKSALAVHLAPQLNAEIINADSQQVYRGCDIGTGKPSREVQRRVPHHLLDMVAPDQQWNTAQFLQHADAAVAAIHARGRRVILVGGTGLYLKRFVWGLCEGAPCAPTIRAELEARLAAEGSASLHAELQHCDPEMADVIHPHHSSRILRALEVWRATGRSIRFWQTAHRRDLPRYPVRWVGLQCERTRLRERIATRIEHQLAMGWREEAEQLLAHYGPDIPIFRAIGYRELCRHLQTGTPWADTVTHITYATTHYAKRQMTYLHSIPEIAWYDVATHSFDAVAKYLSCDAHIV